MSESSSPEAVHVPRWVIALLVTVGVASLGGISTSISYITDLSTRLTLLERELVHALAGVEANTAALNTGPRYSTSDAKEDRSRVEKSIYEVRQEYRELRSEIRTVRGKIESVARDMENKLSAHARARAHVRSGLEIDVLKENVQTNREKLSKIWGRLSECERAIKK